MAEGPCAVWKMAGSCVVPIMAEGALHGVDDGRGTLCGVDDGGGTLYGVDDGGEALCGVEDR